VVTLNRISLYRPSQNTRQVITLGLDAIVIADSGEDSLSGTNPLRLSLDGKTAFIQVIANYLKNEGQVVPPVEGDAKMSWSSAPKLNGIYLVSYLTRHGFDIELVDRYYDERDRFSHLLQQSPRAVIISTTFIHSKQALRKLVNDIRSLAPDVYIIAGGPFLYLSYLMLQRSHEQNYETAAALDDFLFLNNNDEPSVNLYIISLRGEQILCEALEHIRSNQLLDALPNSAILEGGRYSFGTRIDDISDAENVVIDWRSLPDRVFESGVVTMQASNGCPYKCAFCNFTKDRRLLFMKPLDELMSELKAVSERGVRYVWFADDNFWLGRGDLRSVCERLAEEELPILWMSFIRATTLKNVNGELLRRSGCIEAQLGLESGDQQVLQNMNKKANPKLYSDVVRNLLGAGVNCSCYFIFGFPGETDETAATTREFIKSIEHPELEGILSWSMFPFILSPMSPIYEPEMREGYGLTGYMQNWKHRTMDSGRAMEHIRKTFLELEDSGPISRGDNLEMLFELTPPKRKRLVALRHKFSKLAMIDHLRKDDILLSFGEALSMHKDVKNSDFEIKKVWKNTH
jgi:anaerobic magnesium-protoporphyrin IX monomethyl ester cyclase